jgi:hypothetical protein
MADSTVPRPPDSALAPVLADAILDLSAARSTILRLERQRDIYRQMALSALALLTAARDREWWTDFYKMQQVHDRRANG